MAVSTEGLDYMPLDGRLGSGAMEGSSNASGATPDGVRNGDRAALQAVVERRGPAVVAFCTQVCGPQDATRAAAEAFARFRAAVRDAPDLHAINPEALLRGATRHAAASMARVPVGPPPHGRLRSRGTQTCEHVPTMLAARANGALGEADLERLARHLDRCERCDAMGSIFHRAELNYQDPPFDTLGTDTSTVLLEALEAVPMESPGRAPAPTHGAPEGETLDGAFGHLPDLEDEIPLEVATVAEPNEEPMPAAVLTESLPEEASELDDTGEEALDEPYVPDGEDVGDETMEWDVLPDVAAEHPAPAAPSGALLEGGRERRSGGAVRGALIALPVLVVAAALVVVLFVSGVLGSDNGSPTAAQRNTPSGIQAPVTTPLPVKVKAKPSSTSQGSSSSASSTTP
jgi:hypothetical protein